MALHLDIDAHGRVAPQTDPARRALADRAGRFVLLPSAADLLVARRTPATGASSQRPRCILAGDLAAFPIADFIAFMQQARLSGVLTVAGEGAERAVAFQEGEVRSAHSTAAGERVGEVAVRLGYVTEAQVADAHRSGKPIGKALVDLGFLTPNDLYKCLHEQVAAVFHGLLLSKTGTFTLVDEDAERPAAPLSVSTQSLLMDGIRRIDELSLFRARIPGPGAFLRRREPKRPVTLKPVEQQLLALVDGRRSVGEVATAAHLNDFDATKILYHLAEAGYVEAVAEPAAALGDPGARLPAIAGGMDELLRLVAGAVGAEQKPTFLAAVQAHLSDERAPFAPLLRRLSPGPDGGLDLPLLLSNLAALRGPSAQKVDAASEAPRLLLDAMRELLFFYLYLVGERIPRDADERLAAEVKRRLQQLEGLAGT
jgi:hypothetical protein